MRRRTQLRLRCLATALALALWVPGLARAQRVADVLVSPSDAGVQVGGATQFFATAYDRDNNAVPSVTSFTWRSSNPRVATIDANGVATGLSPGVTLITARYGSGRSLRISQPASLQVILSAAHAARAGCPALVKEPPGSGTALGLIVYPLRVKLVKGESKQLEYFAVRGDGGNAEPACIRFGIDPGGERIAQVDSFGLVTSVGDTGSAEVRAVVPGNSALQPRRILVTVTSDSVRFPERELSMAIGATDTLWLVVPAQGNRRFDSVGLFEFMSSDTTKVRVSPIAPIVTAVGSGVARVVATSSFYPDLTVTVVVRR